MSSRMKEGVESQYDDPDSYRGDYPPDWAYRIVFRKQLDNNTCTNCGTRFPAEDLEVVRRIPAENGGTNKTTNLLTVCSFCEIDIKQTGRLNLPESANQEPASSPETDSHRVLALQSEVPISEEVEGETEPTGSLAMPLVRSLATSRHSRRGLRYSTKRRPRTATSSPSKTTPTSVLDGDGYSSRR